MHRLEAREGTSSKFWEGWTEQSTLTVRFGRIGTNGQTRTKTLASAEDADGELAQLLQKKLKEGYVEVEAVGPGAEDAASSSEPFASEPEDPGLGAEAHPPPADEEPRVHWTDAAAARRQVAQAPCSVPVVDHAALFVRLHDLYRSSAEAGEALARPGAAEAMQRIRHNLAERAAGRVELPFDVEDEAALAVLLGAATDLVVVWVDLAGLAFAVQAVLAMRRWGIWLPPSLPRGSRVLSGADQNGPAPPWPVLFHLLQRFTVNASPAEYAAVRAAAAAARPLLQDDRTGQLRAWLAFVFPREADWALEETRDHKQRGGYYHCWPVIAVQRDRAALSEMLCAVSPEKLGEFAFDVVHNLGPDAASPLSKVLVRGPAEGVVEALALIESVEAAKGMAILLTAPHARRQMALEYYDRFPWVALRALLGIDGTRARMVASSIARRFPTWLDDPRLAHDEASLAAVIALQEERALARASLADLPEVLAAPPWQRPRPPARPAHKAVALTPVTLDEEVCWREGEREELIALGNDGQRTPGRDRAILFVVPEHQRAIWGVAYIAGMLTDEGLSQFIGTRATAKLGVAELVEVLARLGLTAVSAIAEHATSGAAVEVLARVRSPRVASLMALALRRGGGAASTAKRWLSRFPEAGAAGVIPMALGPEGPPREAGLVALRTLGALGHGKVVLAMADRYAQREVVAAALSHDRLLDLPRTVVLGPPGKPCLVPALPGWLRVAELRPLVLRSSGARLPAVAVHRLCTMLAFSPSALPYVGIADVKEVLDPKRLAAWAWDLFQRWLLASGPAEDKWAFFALGHYGDDTTATRLTPLIRRWPHAGQIARSQVGLEVLAMIGTDTALRELHAVAQRARSAGLEKRARALIEAVAEARGLEADELADRLVPDLGLDPDGSMTLDYGARKLRVTLDHHLMPHVVDARGVSKTAVVKAQPGDDAVKAKAAQKAFKDLQTEARAIASQQLLRVELAMRRGRRWSLAELRALFVGHPVLVHLARRLVWAAHGEEERTLLFRVESDGRAVDASGAPIDLGGASSVGVPHPLSMGDRQLLRFAEAFRAARLEQPFPQLGREVFPLVANEGGASELRRFSGFPVPAKRLFALQERGWRRGPAGDSAMVSEFELPLHPARALPALVLHFEPGFPIYDPTAEGDQTLGALELRGDRRISALGQLDDVVVSEAIRDVTWLSEARRA